MSGTAQSEVQDQYPSRLSAWTALSILAFTYLFSFLDRQILTLLIDPIKNDLQISDTEVSLLSGFAFALVYTLTGVFMGRAADLWVRKYVIMTGVTIWSLLTMACGFAQNFTQLFLARMGVGFGEAALTPTAYAMIPDLFPPERMARAMSVFVVVGVVGGGGASLLIGGLVIGMLDQFENIVFPVIGEIQLWQAVLVVVGLASLCMVIPLALMKEPKRHENPELKSGDLSFKAVLTYIYDNRAFYFTFTAGVCFMLIAGYGMLSWVPSYFIRVVGWEASTAGVTLGLIFIPPSVLGGLFAGWLSDKLREKGFMAAPLVIMILAMIGMGLTMPFVVMMDNITAKICALVIFYFCSMMTNVLFPSILQQATPPHIRAQVSALFLFCINMAGLGFGATSVALVTDFVFRDEMAVGHSIVIVTVVCAVIFSMLVYRAIEPFRNRLRILNQT
ncbi:MFS transporter [Emcibacter sp.]|uniref:MFS transporter n=1 Tax=Emcibacter sp. TaxID=1979954 RepID=UPI003A8CDC7F